LVGVLCKENPILIVDEKMHERFWLAAKFCQSSNRFSYIFGNWSSSSQVWLGHFHTNQKGGGGGGGGGVGINEFGIGMLSEKRNCLGSAMIESNGGSFRDFRYAAWILFSSNQPAHFFCLLAILKKNAVLLNGINTRNSNSRTFGPKSGSKPLDRWQGFDSHRCPDHSAKLFVQLLSLTPCFTPSFQQ